MRLSLRPDEALFVCRGVGAQLLDGLSGEAQTTTQETAAYLSPDATAAVRLKHSPFQN